MGRSSGSARRLDRAGLANVFPVGAVTKGRKGESLAEIGLMAGSGAVGFSDDGSAVGSAGLMDRALGPEKGTSTISVDTKIKRGLPR